MLATAQLQLGVAVLESAGKCTQNAHNGVTVHSSWEMHTKRPQLVHKLGSAQKLPQPWCSFSRTRTAQCSWEMHTIRPQFGLQLSVAVHSSAWCGCAQRCWEMHTNRPQSTVINWCGRPQRCWEMHTFCHRLCVQPLAQGAGKCIIQRDGIWVHHSANMLGRPPRFLSIPFAFGCTLTFWSSPKTGQAQ